MYVRIYVCMYVCKLKLPFCFVVISSSGQGDDYLEYDVLKYYFSLYMKFESIIGYIMWLDIICRLNLSEHIRLIASSNLSLVLGHA